MVSLNDVMVKRGEGRQGDTAEGGVTSGDFLGAKKVKRSVSLSTENKPAAVGKKSLFGTLFGGGGKRQTGEDAQIVTATAVESSSSSSSPSLSSLPSPSPSPTTETRINASLGKVALKRVAFSVDKFTGDPPQQLPSRNPKKGNVLIPHEMVSEVPSISLGISTSLPQDTNETQITRDSKEYKQAVANYDVMVNEAKVHQREAHYAAKRIADEVATFKYNDDNKSSDNGNGNVTAESPINTAGLEIDMPIHMHEHYFEATPPEDELTLDVVYTRCCHLREILPIPSTLRQVRGKTAPLQVLKFLNAKPTLIDCLSFCDFLQITPINTIVFDNVNLSSEMFRILIKSLAQSKVLEKLSLRNVIIDKENWTLLCKFLLRNKSIVKLDLSQTHTKFKTTDYLGNKLQPQDPLALRHNLDWGLFSNVLVNRRGKPIEELLLNGVKFSQLPNTDMFESVLTALKGQPCATSSAVKIRLGLATSEISLDCIKTVFTWMSGTGGKFQIQGVDLSHNDLSSYIKPMVGRLSSLQYNNLEYFTLNNTQLLKGYDLALILKYLSKLPNLVFLDLGNLPQLFPDILPYIYKYLPRFMSLKRIHLDNNNLTYRQMAVVSNVLMKCKSLKHISITQPSFRIESESVSTLNLADCQESFSPPQERRPFGKNALWFTFYNLVKTCPNLVGLDINYEEMPEEIQSRIAICLMRNMNRAMDSTFQLDELTSQDDLLFDGNLVTASAEDVLKKLSLLNIDEFNKVCDQKGEASKNKDASAKRYLLKKYFENLQKVHESVLHKIDSMFEKRNTGELTLTEKENLLRFLLLEKNLSHIFELLNNTPQMATVLNSLKLKVPHIQNKHFQSSQQVGSNADIALSPPEVLEARPHLMATDSGKTIDCSTGKPVLFRRSSGTLVHSKEQEVEEGELHKWGFYVQQQRSIYPANNNEPQSDSTVQTSSVSLPSMLTAASSSPESPTTPTAQQQIPQPKTLITKIPSGQELRSAIIKAKGIDSIEELIHNVSDEQVELQTIYGDSVQCSKVTEAYDKLLNDISVNRAR
ncbi:protein phosphatase regulator GIP3 KNAG_0J01550 [Huiozyma naganishii CBS 8797]|uniref:Uncharacterized protein n=1 Tax=Huiozyma naganishii (strain ATCC MYA-139 / BCRC 22969 / CBS 8797 / KCTC 17520 / NBRC 10181 / NCYC 3082 / Yp74L-3) TaxID=1071383 RepID=J7SAJ9_HUIN7|nr:hypothetical protein KNAG_0J01550 [Kazachstania naganishii CBS 8797]CCK72236.1 hypothetical protein KNAG_0J01550 [Kazachstania naganishii CBS 8797]